MVRIVWYRLLDVTTQLSFKNTALPVFLACNRRYTSASKLILGLNPPMASYAVFLIDILNPLASFEMRPPQ